MSAAAPPVMLFMQVRGRRELYHQQTKNLPGGTERRELALCRHPQGDTQAGMHPLADGSPWFGDTCHHSGAGNFRGSSDLIHTPDSDAA